VTTLLKEVSLIPSRDEDASHVGRALPVASDQLLSPEMFGRMLYVERKRSERSGRSFVLMLLECTALLKAGIDDASFARMLTALSGATRDTDIKGWHTEAATIGVIFTELGADADGRAVANALLTKVAGALSSVLSITEINEVKLSFHVFPEEWDKHKPRGSDEPIYDQLLHKPSASRGYGIVKRSMDIFLSALALIIGLPVFIAVALAVKLTSRGPVLFRQERCGLYGRTFNFLKFRSMYTNSDPAIHREFVTSFISNGTAAGDVPSNDAAYKLPSDPRITRIGSFLRKTSLDELPQFLNVLKGDMSLVGPRPPLPYEVVCYQLWHKTRLLAAKPGITGLWQVNGRSRVKFDDMVRMDLQYADSRSLWLDIQILLQTPVAVLSGNGAR
jgi:lipopolysaccharide/colanic/teichoic acid biosynthesis glycosyltransferase